jgi:flagellar assembly factor FliW
MKFRLQRFCGNDIDIDPRSIITFPHGLAPFTYCKRYKLFHEEGHPSVFWLQSLDNPDLLFSLTDPDLLRLSYEVTLSNEEQALLEVAQGDELWLAVILYKEGDAAHAICANTRAPIVLNTTKRLGLQKMLQEFEISAAIKGR